MDIILNKIESIKRCIKRILEEYDNKEDNLLNYTKQDSIVLNLQRACELSIDLSNCLVSKYSLGIPQSSRESFEILSKHGIIDDLTSLRMKKMVGFRNIAVHEYQLINEKILSSIINNNLSDFENFYIQLLEYVKRVNPSISGETK